MKSIYVAWQEPNSRQWMPVGRLTKDESDFKFVYTRGAKKFPSFTPFGRMKDLYTVYKSEELFPLFANRILSKSRPEYEKYLHWLGMDRQEYDVMEELSRTAGLRATDSLELFHCPTPKEDNTYEVRFFSRGLRHMHTENQERAATLKVGERLFLMQDLQNEYDSMALLMRTDDPVSLVGYAPRYYSAELTELIEENDTESVKVTVERVNTDAPIQYRVLCKIKAPWPAKFTPCSQEQFQALA